MHKLTATVLVVVISIAALLWLYAQPDPVPEFPEPSGESTSSKSKVTETGLSAPSASGQHSTPTRANDPARATTESPDADPNAEVAALGAQNTEETAIPITPGFESLLESSPRDRSRAPPAALEQHRTLLAETRDEEWAGRIESGIRAFIESRLAAQGLDPHRIELPVIECRATLCEVQALGVALDADSPRNVQRLAAEMVQGPLASEFSDSSTEEFGLPDGRVGYLVFLTRNRGS